MKVFFFILKYCHSAVMKNQVGKMQFMSILFTNSTKIQSNLSVADMLYNRHLVIVDTFLRNWQNHIQTPIEKSLYCRQADTFFEHHNILGKIYLLIADTSRLVGKIENKCMLLFGIFLYFNMKLII